MVLSQRMPEGHHACLTGVTVGQVIDATMRVLRADSASSAADAILATS
jgi:hypothetical protein